MHLFVSSMVPAPENFNMYRKYVIELVNINLSAILQIFVAIVKKV